MVVTFMGILPTTANSYYDEIMRDRSTSVKRELPTPERRGTNVLFDVWLVSRSTTALLDAALAPIGLTADEFGVYSVLMTSDTMTPSELARWMSAPPTTVSSYVKRFEARGHVERRRHPDDGRSTVLRLTPSGRRAHTAAGRQFLPVLDRVVADLGRDEPKVRAALRTLGRALDG
jgi:DNA-binding MarR family transcriptional regulator